MTEKNICKFYYSGLINVVNKKLVKVMKRKQQPYIKNGQVIWADNLHKNKCKWLTLNIWKCTQNNP